MPSVPLQPSFSSRSALQSACRATSPTLRETATGTPIGWSNVGPDEQQRRNIGELPLGLHLLLELGLLVLPLPARCAMSAIT
jgi:hypothetical protein